MGFLASHISRRRLFGAGLTFPSALAWVTAFLAVFSLYAHTFVGRPEIVTPVMALLIAAGLVSMSMMWLRSPLIQVPSGVLRGASAYCLFACWVGFTASGLHGFFGRTPTVSDWGIFLVQTGVPILLFFNRERVPFLRAIGLFSVLFATIDAITNIGSASGLWEIADAGARYNEFGLRVQRFGGLTGNSLASGFVAFIATGFIASRLRRPQRIIGFVAAVALITLIGTSLFLTDARRYIGAAAAVLALLALPWGRFVTLPFVSAILAGGGVLLTFRATDTENIQRANLMAEGWKDAASKLFLGDGIFYRMIATSPSFNDMWAAHATESGAIDLAIAYGWPSTIAFLLAGLFAIGARRGSLTWPSVVLAVALGQTAYTSPIDGFLGSIVFYGCLIFIMLDEAPTAVLPISDDGDGPSRNKVAAHAKPEWRVNTG